MGDLSRRITALVSRFLTILLLAASLVAVAGEPFPKGQVIPKVTCLDAPEFSYALYLPTQYREDRTWPVLFGFSPGGAGREPVDLFAATAEHFGYIVVGSNDSRNGPIQPSLQAQAALWKDVRDRFQVDPRRCYSVGFSGGARMALRLAMDHKGAFAGVISLGAFGTGEDPVGMGHVGFVLACGEEDFNHWEMLRGVAALKSKGWKVLGDRYPNGHIWPPEEFCMESLAFFHVLAMERGLVPEDAEFRSAFLAGRRGAAEAAEARGDLLLAKRRWEDLAADFPATSEGIDARNRISLLSKMPSMKAESVLEAKYERRRADFQRLRGTSYYGKELLQLHDQLARVPRAEAQNIRRILSAEAMKFQGTAIEAMMVKDWDRAAHLLSFQETFQEKDPWPCVYLAAVYCQMGKPEDAIEQLKEGYRRGYRQGTSLRAWALLKQLHGRPDFEQLLREMSPSKPEPL